MRRLRRIPMLLPIILSAILTACGGAGAPAGQDVNAIYTNAISSMAAAFFATQTALAPTETPIPSSTPTLLPYPTVPPLPSVTPSVSYFYPISTLTPFATPTPTGTIYTPTVDPASLASGCNNLAFVRDVTIPGGTVLLPNQNFTKTWKVANIGTCPWLYQYGLVLLSGNSFGAGPTKLGREVDAGHWAEVSANMDAPKTEGSYTSYWRMADSSGSMFGATLVVSFVVQRPTPVPSSTPLPSATPTFTSAPSPTDTATSSAP